MKRRNFIRNSVLGVMTLPFMNLETFSGQFSDFALSEKMPVLFLAHGSPMNAITDNPFTRSLRRLGKEITRPRAIVMVSAHWESQGTMVSSNAMPETIYDFGGFPPELYRVKYPAPGSPGAAGEVRALNAPRIGADPSMGLDHGAWSVLVHLFPEADIPVFQLSIDRNLSPREHFDLARSLSEIRNRGLLLIGSGNIVHNLRRLDWSSPDAAPIDWAREFDDKIQTALVHNNSNAIIDYQKLGASASLAVPTNEHFVPLLYALGMRSKDDQVSFPWEGYEYGSLSMRCVKFS